MARVTRKKSPSSSVTLAKINTKLDHIHRDLEKNTKDIAALKEQMAMGKGGLKVVAWLGVVVGGIVTAFGYFR